MRVLEKAALGIAGLLLLLFAVRFFVPREPKAEVSFGQIQERILRPKCILCHGIQGEVNLETYSRVLEVVRPGDPESSRLYRAAKSGAMPAPVVEGGRLRQTFPRLTDQELGWIRGWIARGAPER